MITKFSLGQGPGTQPEGTKHGAVFAIQNGSSVSSDANTVTSLLTLLSVLDVALVNIILIGISIFNLSAGVVPKPQVPLIF